MNDVVIKKSKIGQFEKGVFANRDFRMGETVVTYKNLKPLAKEEFQKLPKREKKFTHMHWGVTYLYPSPARYVNHSEMPNTVQNLKKRCDVAVKDIKKGEEITTDAKKDDTPHSKEFSERVYAICKKIPRGKVTTYKIIAEKLNTKAYQAIGQALRKNSSAPFVPCHRVVSSTGDLHGFKGKKKGKALEEKKVLLEREGVKVENDKINLKKYLYRF